MSDQAYTSTVIAPVQVGLAIVAAAAILFFAVVVGTPPWPIGVIAAIIIVATGLYLSTVRLMIGANRVLLGQGAWGRARVVAAGDVVGCHSATLGWAQVFGIGVPFHRRTTRLTIRPGPTLCLTLSDGEHVRISTPDPDTAARLLCRNEAT